MEEVRKIALHSIEQCFSAGATYWKHIKSSVKDDLGKFLFNRTKRRPMILPVIMNV